MMPTPHIIHSRRSSISLEITRDGMLVVKAPLFTPQFFINKFLEEKREWIQNSLAKVERRIPQKRKYTEGETFLFLGKEYPLKIINSTAIAISNEALVFPKAILFRIQKELEAWYIHQAKEIISKRVVYHAERMQARYGTLLFSDTKSKWGTCTHENNLQFNWKLIMAPLMVLDYVVIHELAHTKEKNHGRSFWSIVRLHTPAYRQHRKWLETHAHRMTL